MDFASSAEMNVIDNDENIEFPPDSQALKLASQNYDPNGGPDSQEIELPERCLNPPKQGLPKQALEAFDLLDKEFLETTRKIEQYRAVLIDCKEAALGIAREQQRQIEDACTTMQGFFANYKRAATQFQE
ncbi:uncharacterized protein LOC144167574 [Haemaphysalis longicornis]